MFFHIPGYLSGSWPLSTWLKLSGGAVGMQDVHNDYKKLLFNLHVHSHSINCDF